MTFKKTSKSEIIGKPIKVKDIKKNGKSKDSKEK